MARRRSANKNGIPNPFNPMDPDWQTTTTTTAPRTSSGNPKKLAITSKKVQLMGKGIPSGGRKTAKRASGASSYKPKKSPKY